MYLYWHIPLLAPSGNALCVVERAPQSSELLRRRQMEEEDDVYMAKVAEQVR